MDQKDKFDSLPQVIVFLCEFSKILDAKNFVLTKFRRLLKLGEENFVKICVQNFVMMNLRHFDAASESVLEKRPQNSNPMKHGLIRFWTKQNEIEKGITHTDTDTNNWQVNSWRFPNRF